MNLPSGVNSSTSARWNSSGWVSASSTLECEPTEAKSFVPSSEKAKIAGPVAAAAQAAAAGQIGELLHGAAWL